VATDTPSPQFILSLTMTSSHHHLISHVVSTYEIVNFAWEEKKGNERHVTATFRRRDQDFFRTLRLIQVPSSSASSLHNDTMIPDSWMDLTSAGGGHVPEGRFDPVHFYNHMVDVLQQTPRIWRLFGDGSGSTYKPHVHRFLQRFVALVLDWLQCAFSSSQKEVYTIVVVCDAGMERSVAVVALFLALCDATAQLQAMCPSGLVENGHLHDYMQHATNFSLLEQLVRGVEKETKSNLVPQFRQFPTVWAVSGQIKSKFLVTSMNV
jgi:hypothetical protein